MNIEEGQFYRVRDSGMVVGPMIFRKDSGLYHWTTTTIFREEKPDTATIVPLNQLVWTSKGDWDATQARCSLDLVEKVMDPRPEKKVGEVVYIGSDNKLPEEKRDMSNPAKPNESIWSSVTGTVKSVREKIRPYDKYIVMAAVVIAIDYFVFDGKISEKTKEIFKRLSNKFITTLDKVIDKIGE
jgi:hypothetical protein